MTHVLRNLRDEINYWSKTNTVRSSEEVYPRVIALLDAAIREQEQQAEGQLANQPYGQSHQYAWPNNSSAAQSAREKRIDAVMRAYNSAVINKNAITRWDAKGLVAVLEAWEGMKDG